MSPLPADPRGRAEAGPPATLLRDFVDELVRAGLRDAVVCPGSRSTPLALALRAHPAVSVRVMLDERSAGFFALGLAKAARRPVAVLVTSGTAAANLLPAAVEATLGRVPLLLFTADRPAELRDVGAPQTIDQTRLFGVHAKWYVELPIPDREPGTARRWCAVAGRAVATALEGPAGVVHLDLPFREPLVPEGDIAPAASRGAGVPADGDRGAHPTSRLVAGRRTLDAGELEALAARLRAVERGLIVAGPQDDPALPAALARLAAATGWPILADPLSLARTGPHDRTSVVAHGDLLLRPGRWRDAHVPELVLRFGAPPTSKPVAILVAETAPVQVIVDGDLGWRDPSLGPATVVHADGPWLAGALADTLGRSRAADRDAAWTAAWRRGDDAVAATLADWLAEATGRGDSVEMEPFSILPELLPDGAILWASSSMPVRDMDAWLPSIGRAIRPLANRGANGIDGVVSSALGAAAAGEGRVALVVGDLAFLHDLNALVAASRLALSATIILVNNDGGGIFSFLPQAGADAPGAGLPAHYEELFGTPHGVEPGPLVAALGGRHLRPAPGGLRAALADALDSPGVTVVELRTDRGRNLELHREVAARVAVALEGLAPSPPRRPAGVDR